MSTESKSITVEMARAAVLASGLLEDIAGPSFTADGETWTRYWISDVHPVLARVALKRTGMPVREVVISWAEYESGEELTPDWNATRALKPMSVFGGECERHAYRVVFADILAPLLATLPDAPAANEHATGDPWAPARNWDAELAAVESVEALNAMWAEAKGARTAALERAFRLRKAQLSEAVPRLDVETAAMPSPDRAPRPAPAVVPRPPSPTIPHLEPVKPVTRKGESRARRDTGKRGGGRRG